MKTNTHISRFLAVSAIALTLPLSAMAFGRDDNRCDRGDNNRPAMEMRHGGGMSGLRGIDLTADQISAMTKLSDDHRKQATEKRDAMRDQHDALRKLVMSDNYTPAAAAEIINKIGAAQTEMAKLRADEGNQIYKLLTPEQRTKMQQNELMGMGFMGDGPMGHGHKR